MTIDKGGGNTMAPTATMELSKLNELQHSSVSRTPENKRQRETWTNETDFVVAAIGLAVGLGNVWRFPYLCYKHGGGAFLIPYLVSLIIPGIGLFLMELGLGQFMQRGAVACWNICPIFKGIGGASIVVIILLDLYYAIVIAWAVYYLFMSFTPVLPWSHCNNSWNTPACYQPELPFNSSMSSCKTTPVLKGLVCINGTLRNSSELTNAVDEFWERKILKIHLSDGIGDPGGMNWMIVLCLALSWVLVFLCICQGVRLTGKVVYFTALAPYVLLCILLGFSLSLDHASDGIKFYMQPDWTRLGDVQVWMDATTQIFFSYILCTGAQMALSSYNKPSRNFIRDGLLIACINSGTSIFAGFNVFAVLGFMAAKHGTDIATVAKSGPGLIFIAYPEGIAQMPASTLWAILFFLMVLLLGLDSQFVGVEALITAIVDLYPDFFAVGHRRMLFIAFTCVSFFMLGLTMCTSGGMYLFQLFDYYAVSGLTLLWVAFFECVAIGWVYGGEKFSKCLSQMIGFEVWAWLRINWTILSPLYLAVIFMCTVVLQENVVYNNTYVYPTWGYVLGYCMSFASMIQIPLYAIVKLLMQEGTFTERWKVLTTPTDLPAWYESEQTDETPLVQKSKHAAELQ